MKSFGKVILGIIIAFFAIIIFNYTSSFALHKDVGKQGDEAYVSNDLTFFKNRFEYHKEEPLFEKHIEFEIEINEVIEEGSFDLYMFHSANIKQEKGNYLAVLVKDLKVPERVKLTQMLNLYFDYSGSKREEDPFAIVKIGKENWYLQWIKIKERDILGFKLKHGEILLYEYDLEEPLLKVENLDLVHIIEKKEVSYGVITSMSNDAIDLGFDERKSLDVKETEYEVKFEYILGSGVELKEDLYLSGEFNNWEVGNENYKLKKNKSGVYQITLDIESEFDDVYYNIVTKDGYVVSDKDNNVRYFIYEFVSSDDKNLADFNIFKSEQVSFNGFSYYKWIAMGIYFGVLLTVGLLIYFLNKRKVKKAVYTTPPITKDDEINQVE